MGDSKQKTFLGTGWSFPPSFDFQTKKVVMVSAEEDIKQSLIILLSTMKNERVMLPDYGSDLAKLLFEEMDSSLHHYIVDLIKKAIIVHEARIDVETVDLKMEVETIFITIAYIIRDINSRHNLVYPFYIHQGTNIEKYDKIY